MAGKPSAFISPAGAGIALICFFLPWVKLDCGNGMVKNFSGANIGGVLWIVFLAALASLILFFVFYSSKKLHIAKLYIIISSALGLLTMVMKYITFKNSSGSISDLGIKPQDIGISIQAGSIMSALGFVLSIVGALLFKKEIPEAIPAAAVPGAVAIKCPKCGKEYPAAQAGKFCDMCGTQL
jgi:hypothetical protein